MYKTMTLVGKVAFAIMLMTMLSGCPELLGGLRGVWYIALEKDVDGEGAFSIDFSKEEVVFTSEWTEEDEELFCSEAYFIMGSYTANKKADPKEIDFSFTKVRYEECCGDDCEYEEDDEPMEFLGIYDFVDGRLVLSMNEGMEGRPGSFEESADFQTIALPASERKDNPNWDGQQQYRNRYRANQD